MLYQFLMLQKRECYLRLCPAIIKFVNLWLSWEIRVFSVVIVGSRFFPVMRDAIPFILDIGVIPSIFDRQSLVCRNRSILNRRWSWWLDRRNDTLHYPLHPGSLNVYKNLRETKKDGNCWSFIDEDNFLPMKKFAMAETSARRVQERKQTIKRTTVYRSITCAAVNY